MINLILRNCIHIGVMIAAMAISMPACMIDDGQPQGMVATAEYDLRTSNGLILNNGLNLNNGLQLSDGTPLPGGLAGGYGLSVGAGLATDAGLKSSMGYLTSEAGQQFIHYLVECALPLGRSITKLDPLDGGTITFEGHVGLAPQWETDHCNKDCQAWVSACLLARTNANGVTVNIELVASHSALGPTRTKPEEFIYEEAGFYGNLFLSPPVAYSCRGAQVTEASYRGRLCGLTPWESCGFKNVVGECAAPDSCGRRLGDTYTHCKDAVGKTFRTITTYTPAL